MRVRMKGKDENKIKIRNRGWGRGVMFQDVPRVKRKREA